MDFGERDPSKVAPEILRSHQPLSLKVGPFLPQEWADIASHFGPEQPPYHEYALLCVV
jgi:hypothetical protein